MVSAEMTPTVSMAGRSRPWADGGAGDAVFAVVADETHEVGVEGEGQVTIGAGGDMAAIAADLAGGAAAAVEVEQGLATGGDGGGDSVEQGLGNKFAQPEQVFVAHVDDFGSGMGNLVGALTQEDVANAARMSQK
jgi:hypothetical protein